MNVQHFDLASVTPTPWKNGGGTTRELACWPAGAGMNDFGWRVSVATVTAPGPFSVFPGVQRHIMLMQGDGLVLHRQPPMKDLHLDIRWTPWAFDGEEAIRCTMMGGESIDFNLMARRGVWSGAPQVVRQSQQPGVAPAGLCMVLSGQWRWGAETLETGQGFWWAAPAPGLEPVVPQPGAGAVEPAMVWIELAPESEKNSLHRAPILP